MKQQSFILKCLVKISTKLPTRYLYGFGENTHDSLLHNMLYKMWPIFSRGQAPGKVSEYFNREHD